MKFLIAGSWHSELHEESVARALAALGQEVGEFRWHEYFIPRAGWMRAADEFQRRAQNKLLAGPELRRLNRDLVAKASRERPDAVLIYRGTHVFPETLRCLREAVPGIKLLGYNNDDPFGPEQPRYMWRHFLAGVPEYDLMLAYRRSNLYEFQRAGARRVELLRSWFIPERNHPVSLSAEDAARYDCDVAFVGHYEPDQRVSCLEAIVRRGWRLRLFGPGYDWDPVIRRSPELKSQIPVRLVWGEDYNRALCGARIALCFLSKFNRDTYTRRCFEIPAAGTLMLSEYSEDLATLFQEGKEAEFFRDQDEMMTKLEIYLNDDSRRRMVAEAGVARVHRDGHDVMSRMRQVVAWMDEMRIGRQTA